MYFHNKLDLLLLEHQRSLPQMTMDYEETNFGDVGQTVFSYHISEKLASLSGSQEDLAASQTMTIQKTLPSVSE